MRRQIDHRRRIVLPSVVDDWGTREVEVKVGSNFVLVYPPKLSLQDVLRVLRVEVNHG
jgi:hypothetical protein